MKIKKMKDKIDARSRKGLRLIIQNTRPVKIFKTQDMKESFHKVEKYEGLNYRRFNSKLHENQTDEILKAVLIEA